MTSAEFETIAATLPKFACVIGAGELLLKRQAERARAEDYHIGKGVNTKSAIRALDAAIEKEKAAAKILRSALDAIGS